MALLFPGQGSLPSRGQLQLTRETELGRRLVDLAASEANIERGDFFRRGGQDLARTEVLQPLVVAISVALGVRVVEQLSDRSALTLLGHSLGELSALAVAGVVNAEDAVRLASVRGRAMGQAARIDLGGLVAIQPDRLDKARRAAAAQDSEAWIALDNAADELVLACRESAIASVLRATGGTRLRVQGAWHCPLMTPAVAPLQMALNDIPMDAARLPVLSCIDLAIIDQPDVAQGCLLKGLTSMVRYREALARLSPTRFVIAGPGAALRALLRRTYGAHSDVRTTETQRELEVAA